MTNTITRLLAVVVFTGWAGMANAATVVISGFGADDGSYEIGLVNCTFHTCGGDSSLLTSQNWWGNQPLANALVDDIGLTGLGIVNSDFGGSGPYFAFSRNGSGLSTNVAAWLGFGIGSGNTSAVDGTFYNFAIATSFTPAVVPVPAAAWLFGSALLGLGAIQRKRA